MLIAGHDDYRVTLDDEALCLTELQFTLQFKLYFSRWVALPGVRYNSIIIIILLQITHYTGRQPEDYTEKLFCMKIHNFLIKC